MSAGGHDRRAVATDHAVLRYLERVHGMDVDAVRRRIERIAQPGVELGARALNVGRHKYVLHGPTVVTVLGRCWSRGAGARLTGQVDDEDLP